jgi:hypothetical protein
MKFAKLVLLATAFAAAPIAAHAQDAGTTVFGNDDAPIGSVESNAGGIVTINTGKHMAPLPAELLAEREGKWTVNATRDQIDGMMDQQVAEANAARDAALVEGAMVMSADGQPAGAIYTIDSEGTVIIKSNAGIVTVTRDAFAADANGALLALYTAQQLSENTVAVPAGAEILTPAQARAKESGLANSGETAGASE